MIMINHQPSINALRLYGELPELLELPELHLLQEYHRERNRRKKVYHHHHYLHCVPDLPIPVFCIGWGSRIASVDFGYTHAGRHTLGHTPERSSDHCCCSCRCRFWGKQSHTA